MCRNSVPIPWSLDGIDVPLRKSEGWLLAVVAVIAWFFRAVPLLRAGGPLEVPLDFDEGVYLSASAWLWKGMWPYRDFVFVHPPGVVIVLGALTRWIDALGTDGALSLARWGATLVGALNVVLVGRLVGRWVGGAFGLVAAVLYASYPEAAVVERGPFLEPILNGACLSFALLWLEDRASWTRSLFAGSLLGFALSVKLWAGLWCLAALVSLPSKKPWRHLLVLTLGAAAVFAAVVGPFVANEPLPFFIDVLGFHAWRPPDHDPERLSRIPFILGGIHAVASILAGAGVVLGLFDAQTRGTRSFRFALTAYALTVASFLASSAYWTQYNAHLAASEVLLAGVGASLLWRSLVRRRPSLANTPSIVLPVVLAALAFPSAQLLLERARRRAPDQLALAQAARQWVPPDACWLTLEPGWALLAGRLPEVRWVDPYAMMLRDATHGGVHFASADEAFASPKSQAVAQMTLESCRFVSVGPRGRRQLSRESLDWIEAHFTRRFVAGELDLWERN